MEPSQELQHDLQELEKFMSMAVQPNVRKLLASEVSTLRTKITELKKAEATKSEEIKASKVEDQKPTKPSVYTTQITNYGWDHSMKFAKIYVTLPGVENLPADQVTCNFTDKSFHFTAHNLNGKNHVLKVTSLAYNIRPDASNVKVKTGNVIINLRKATDGQPWKAITEADRKTQEAKDEKFATDNRKNKEDPSGGIMDLMKKMYDDGDDDMKRMIKKTWYESQQKGSSGGGMPGGMPGMPGMPGM